MDPKERLAAPAGANQPKKAKPHEPGRLAERPTNVLGARLNPTVSSNKT